MQRTGEAVPIVDNLPIDSTNESAPVSISQSGILVYTSGGLARSGTQFAWYDRGEKLLDTVGAPGRDLVPAISPDGNLVSFMRPASSGADLWLWDVKRRFERRLTTDPSVNRMAVWSPQSDRIVFASNRTGGVFDLYQRTASAPGKDELLYADGKNKPKSGS